MVQGMEELAGGQQKSDGGLGSIGQLDMRDAAEGGHMCTVRHSMTSGR